MGGGFLAQVQACGGGGGGGRGLKVNWLCGLLCMSKREEKKQIKTYSPTLRTQHDRLTRISDNITCEEGGRNLKFSLSVKKKVT